MQQFRFVAVYKSQKFYSMLACYNEKKKKEKKKTKREGDMSVDILPSHIPSHILW